MRDLLLASAQRLIVQHSDGPAATDNTALWRAIVEAGFARVRLGDEQVELTDGFALISLAAQLGARIPLGDVLMADWVLMSTGVRDAPLCTWAADSDFKLGDDGLVSGVAHDVAGVCDCAHLLSTVIDARGDRHFVVAEIARSAIAPRVNLAGEARHSVVYRQAPGEIYATALSAADVKAIAALARCAQMNGSMARVLDLVLEHAATRVQFGKPLAKLQAVQQMLAVIAGQLALALAAVDRAADAKDLHATAFFAAIAKAIVSEAASKVAAGAHQILGAMGFSQEHELQHHTRALWAWRDEMGCEDEWRALIGRRVFSAGGAGLWPMLAQP